MNFHDLDNKWQKYWKEHQSFKAEENLSKPKYYILDMFPYPSGAGLHVGHPLGYIASDILARYKRNKGYEVLHPMGYDSFGLPAEQYAIETGQHPKLTTEINTKRYREQLDMIGLSFDWSRQVMTSDPEYYKWTQWLFQQFFNSWYNKNTDQAEPIKELVQIFNNEGNASVSAAGTQEETFSADEWRGFEHDEKEAILLNYRLAYLAYSDVNWCEALGTVLANDEVQNGFSVRGNHPVERIKMRQWFLRITAYAERLLEGLDRIDWPNSIKETQRNWIGRSEGARIAFDIESHNEKMEIFTTRPDTLFGVSFMVLAPESEWVDKLCTDDQKEEVLTYIDQAKRKSERERMADVKEVSGVFSGAYSIHPFSKKKLPIWIADYVLADYGTGAVMAVPAHDERDHRFASHFNLPIVPVIESNQKVDVLKSSYDAREGVLMNSDFLNGLNVQEAIITALSKVESEGLGQREINFKLRDAGFSRQRYWGEPFPIVYEHNIPIAVDEDELPVELPVVESYKPGEKGKSPLSRVESWVNSEKGKRETDTMPGNAGSSWYFLRYMDPNNKEAFLSKEKEQYWKQVDFYVGGSEHATGHLLYARFWQKFLYDLAYVKVDEPFKKLINQGMIQGVSAFVYRIKGENKLVSYNLRKEYKTQKINVDVYLVNEKNELDFDAFKKWRADFRNAEFILEDGKYIVGREVEKMSKSKYNVINPDALIENYGCDTFRMYEMFLGPVEQSKPWNTDGIEGVYKFLKKLWNLLHIEDSFSFTESQPSDEELKVLHTCIKNVSADIEKFSLNTCVSHFMIAVNDLQKLNCRKRDIWEPFTILLSPFAPHICEEFWHAFGNEGSVNYAPYPVYNEDYLKEDSFEYPIMVNGKMRAKKEFPLDTKQDYIQEEVLKMPEVIKWIEGKDIKKFIFVKGKIINLAVG